VVQRGAERNVLSLRPEVGCDYGVGVELSPELNAFADGERVLITRGMVDFLDQDDDLALVLGHELAHNTYGHIEKKMGNALVGALLGGLVGALAGPDAVVDAVELGGQLGALAFSQEFEAEADYAGAYFAARAGYEVAGAADIWRRMGARHPEAIDLAGTTHPSTALRYLSLERTAEEIALKKSRRQPLTPGGTPPIHVE
jgi:predicted Zn-dependent protease